MLLNVPYCNSAVCPAEAVQRLLALAKEEAADGCNLSKAGTAKAWAVQHILQSCQRRKEKLVIFCQFLTDLDEMELVLQQVSYL